MCPPRLLVGVLLFLFWGIGPSSAEPGSRRFETVDLGEGLSRQSVNSVVQDPQGFIWIGTDEGLIRYDGYETRAFHRGSDSRHDLGSNRISALLVTSSGDLWVGTRGGGLSRYNPETEDFLTFRRDAVGATSIAQDDVMALVEDDQGRLWIATAHEGLSRLDAPKADGGEFTSIRHQAEDPESLADDRTRTLLFDPQGVLWVGTMGGVDRLVTDDPPRFGHYRNDPSNPTSLEDDEVWSLLMDSDGVLWVGAWGGGLSRLRDPSAAPEEAIFEVFHHSEENESGLSDDRVMELLEDRNGTLWVGTQSGLDELILNERRQENPRFLSHRTDPQWPFSLSDSYIGGLFQDSLGDIWIGTDRGLNRIDRRFEAFLTFRYQPDLHHSLGGIPTTVLMDRQGELWVGHERGVDRIVRSTNPLEGPEITHFLNGEPGEGEFPGGRVFHLMEDSYGFIWASTMYGLVAITLREDPPARPTFLHYLAEFESSAVLVTREDRQRTLWVGTYRGLYEVTRDERGFPLDFSRRNYDPEDSVGLSNEHINALAMGPKGNLWVGTYRGLNRLHPKSDRLTRYFSDFFDHSSLKHDFVNSLLLDGLDRLWVGTRGGGLSLMEESGFRTFGTDQGLPSEIVRSLRQGPGETIWFGSPRALVEFHPETGKSRVFGRSHGLPSDEILGLSTFSGDWISVITDSEVTLFNPDHLRIDSQRPSVELTELRVLNKPVPIARTLC